MYKKILAFLIIIICLKSECANAVDKYIFFVRNADYLTLLQHKEIADFINKSVQGFLVQRNNGEDFGFFQSLKDGKPSSIDNNNVPVYAPNEGLKDVNILGFYEKDGTKYVPSLILFNGQTKLKINGKTFVFHLENVDSLEKEIINLNNRNNIWVIICGWSNNDKTSRTRYIEPFVMYDNLHRGIFYSHTTRNAGIIDFLNARNIIEGELKTVNIIEGDPYEIYKERIEELSCKKRFLPLYGYFNLISIILILVFEKFKLKRCVNIISETIIIFPVAVLVEPIFIITSLRNKIILMIVLIAFFLRLKVKNKPVYAAIVFLTLIYVDAAVFHFLLNHSLLSYEPSFGARFYGIGNEYLGIILAYNFIIIDQNSKKNFCYHLWAVNAILLICGNIGSNFGGFLTCFVMSALCFSLKSLYILAPLSVLFILTSKNHINDFFRNILDNNYFYILQVIKSKIYTFRRLLRLNTWTILSICSLAAYLYEIFLKKIKFSGNKRFFMLCCILVTIFNDSGIVSCALLLSVYLAYIFYVHSE